MGLIFAHEEQRRNPVSILQSRGHPILAFFFQLAHMQGATLASSFDSRNKTQADETSFAEVGVAPSVKTVIDEKGRVF